LKCNVIGVLEVLQSKLAKPVVREVLAERIATAPQRPICRQASKLAVPPITVIRRPAPNLTMLGRASAKPKPMPKKLSDLWSPTTAHSAAAQAGAGYGRIAQAREAAPQITIRGAGARLLLG
jgi:hypothetical protein